MEKRKLGTTDIDVSVICLGTMTWGEQNTEADGHAQLDRALDAGINFIDTAEMYAVPPREETYGRTEDIIGTWLARTGRRSDIVLATKICSRSERFPYVRPHIDDVPRLDPQSVREAVDASLKRLQTDYIDLYQVHWPERPTNFFGQLRYKHREDPSAVPFEETLGALQEAVDAGKIRHIGLSNDTPWGIMHALALSDKKGLPRVQSVQNPYSLLNRSYEVGLAEVSIRETCGLLAYSPLAFGLLSGKYENGAMPADGRITLYPAMARYNGERTREAATRYIQIARDFDLDPAEMALAFIHQQPFVTATIIGATKLHQLDAAIRSADLTLSKEILTALDGVDDDITFPAP